MILTCPECASRYFVDDSAVTQTRKVRCTSCGSSWMAAPEAPALELRRGEDGATAVEPITAADLPGDEISKAFRARVQDRTRIKQAAAAGAVWAGLGAAFALLIAAAMVFRVDVVRIWPKTASAYAGIGLPVNQIGLTIEKVEAQPALQDGRAALTVSGVVRNIRGEPVTPPPLAIALIDKQGRRVMTTRAQPGDGAIPARGLRPFTVSLLEPPPAAADVEISFVLEGRKKPARIAHASTDAKQLGLRPTRAPGAVTASPVEEAKPIEAGSEFALESVPDGH